MIGNILILVIKYLYLNYIDHVLIGFYSQAFQLEHLLCSFLLSLIFLFLLISSFSLCLFILLIILRLLRLISLLRRVHHLRVIFLDNILNCMEEPHPQELLLFQNHYLNPIFFWVAIRLLQHQWLLELLNSWRSWRKILLILSL